MQKKKSKNISTVLAILRDEVRGDVASALKKMNKDYSMTWMYQNKTTLFPSIKIDIAKEMRAVYPIEGRRYQIKHIIEGKNVAMVELIESYPDPKTKKIFRTPLVLVLEMENGKIKTGRHYCDPKLAHLHLSEVQVLRAFKGKNKKLHTIE